MRAKVNTTVLGAFVALLLTACSSKNPDSLVGVNVDENLAIMDANESSNAMAAATNTNDASAKSAPDRTEISGHAGPQRASDRASLAEQDRSTGVKVIESNDAADQDQAGATPSGNEEATPNAI